MADVEYRGHFMEQGKQNGYFWNIVAGMVNASQAVLLSMVVTRTDGLASAGVLSIAFAVASLMVTIGRFGVRNYQATDVQQNFSFSDYFWTRMITVAWMVLISVLYIAFCVYEKGYSSQKASVILALCLINAIEAVEDVFWGFYQQQQAMDVGAKVYIVRWVSILSVFILLLLLGYGLQTAAIVSAVVSLVVFFIFNTFAFVKFHEKIGRMHVQPVRNILQQCLPLACVAFLSFYVTNAPKYAIDRYLSEEVQACYGFIAMPLFVIWLVNGFIYQPCMVQMACEWKNGMLLQFHKRVKRQNVILAGLTILCLCGAYLCGIPVLSALYHTDLRAYKTELLVLLLGGGMLACVEYFDVLLTIMRKQNMILGGYAGTAALAWLLSNWIVKRFGIIGAAIFYAGLMSLLALVFYFMYKHEMKKAAQ